MDFVEELASVFVDDVVGNSEHEIGGDQKPRPPSDFSRGGLADEGAHLLMESMSYLVWTDFRDSADLVAILGVVVSPFP
jgi:hypothetical protein